jgi:hypothetical protein
MFLVGTAVVVGTWRYIPSSTSGDFFSTRAWLLGGGWTLLLCWIVVLVMLELPPHQFVGRSVPSAASASGGSGPREVKFLMPPWLHFHGETLVAARFAAAVLWGSLSALCASVVVVPIALITFWSIGSWIHPPR